MARFFVCLAASIAGAAADNVYEDYAFGSVLRRTLALGEYYNVRTQIPETASALKVAIVPIYGDVDAFMSVNDKFATVDDASWRMDMTGMEEMILRRSAPEFSCPDRKECELDVKLFGFSSSDFLFSVTNLTDPSITNPADIECASGCAHFDLTDNVCHPECNTTDCLYDGGDCLIEEDRCSGGCPRAWIGDTICDEACFVASCDWDGGDCFDDWESEDAPTQGCAAGCLPAWVNDGQCDAECNVPQCNYDGDDCFFGHDECYFQPDGSDYRGNVNRTKSGIACQRWSDQYPHQHTRTSAFYAWAGLGGHNYCRNPDGEAGPWCYTQDANVRFALCDVPAPSASCSQGPEPRWERGEVKLRSDGSCPDDMFMRVRGVCAPCTKCDNGMEERIACSTMANRVCAPACALDAANRFVAEGKGALGVVQALCAFDSWDHNASSYASMDSSKLCSNYCCNAFDIAQDACDYDGFHKDSWFAVKMTLARAYTEVCPKLKVKDCHAFDTALMESRGTKDERPGGSGGSPSRFAPQRGGRPRVNGKVSAGEAIENPLVATVFTLMFAGFCVLCIGLCWYRRRVKRTLQYASPNAPEEVTGETT